MRLFLLWRYMYIALAVDAGKNHLRCYVIRKARKQKLKDLWHTIDFKKIYKIGQCPSVYTIHPRFRENKTKTLVFSHRKRVFWACFRENCVYNFGHRALKKGRGRIFKLPIQPVTQSL